jgi:hypothetical protein
MNYIIFMSTLGTLNPTKTREKFWRDFFSGDNNAEKNWEFYEYPLKYNIQTLHGQQNSSK